jgi:hypothetical protein
MSMPVSAWRAGGLLTRLRLRRQLNQFGASLMRVGARRAHKKATSRTSPVRWLVGATVAIFMLGSFTNLAYQAMVNMDQQLGTTLVRNPAAAVPDTSARQASCRDRRWQ